MDLESTNKNLEEDLDRMRNLNRQKKDELKVLSEQLTTFQFNAQNNLVEDRKQADEGLQLVNTKLASIESEILHLQDPLDKILTCVGRMQNQLKSDGRVAELNIKKLREYSMKWVSKPQVFKTNFISVRMSCKIQWSLTKTI